MNKITKHYCLIDYNQQFAAVDQVCCRKVSFFKMAVPHHWPIKQLRKLKKMGWELLQHLPFSPGLAPSNFHLFGPQSKSLRDINFKNNKDVPQHYVQKFLQVPTKTYAKGSSQLEYERIC